MDAHQRRARFSFRISLRNSKNPYSYPAGHPWAMEGIPLPSLPHMSIPPGTAFQHRHRFSHIWHRARCKTILSFDSCKRKTCLDTSGTCHLDFFCGFYPCVRLTQNGILDVSKWLYCVFVLKGLCTNSFLNWLSYKII
jgi:hypothetical protein